MEAKLQEARLHLDSKRFGDALASAEACIEAASHERRYAIDYRPYFIKGEALAWQGDFEPAKESFNAGLKLLEDAERTLLRGDEWMTVYPTLFRWDFKESRWAVGVQIEMANKRTAISYAEAWALVVERARTAKLNRLTGR